MSDLIARLLDVCQCNLDSSPCGNEDTCLLLREAAAALAAKDAEIVKWRCIGASLAHDLADVLQVLGCCDSESAIERIAALRARITAAEKALRGALDATGRHPLLVGFAHGTPTRQELADRLSEIGAILEAAYDAAKGASDADDPHA